jgi:hypothetical protein
LDTATLDIVYLPQHGTTFVAWIQALGSLLGLAIAIYVPFKVQRNAASRARLEAAAQAREKHVTAGNLAIFELIRTYNKFLVVQVQHIDELKDNFARHVLMRPTLGLNWRPLQIDYDSLSFLFALGDPNLLGDLAMIEQEVAATIETINSRSKMHYEEVQTVVEQASKEHGEKMTVPQLEAALGQRRTIQIKTLTDAMVDGVRDVLLGTWKNIENLREAMLRIYPGEKIAKITASPELARAAKPKDSATISGI